MIDIKINKKLLGFTGCIGRRDYFLNFLYLSLITSILSAPMSYWFTIKPQNLFEIFNITSMINSAPVSVIFFYLLACAISMVVGVGLVSRRLSDIWGKEIDWQILVCAIGLNFISYYCVFNLNPMTTLLMMITFLCNLAILFTIGKVTSQFPHNPLLQFNWGAFWGTWIWGLINKSYKTLWSFLFWIIPVGGLTWSLICGMRGNEWAFRNTKALGLRSFNEGQRKQAVFWNCLAGFLIFIFPFVLAFLIVGTTVSYAIKNPEGMEKINNSLEKVMTTLIDMRFESYEINEDENKFYISPNEWVGMTFDEKMDSLKGASEFSAMKKREEKNGKYYSKSTEMKITKIYSSYNGELLGSFDFNEEEFTDFKSTMKSLMKSVYFNSSPQLP